MSLQHILLGLLRHESGSGYDLNKRLQTYGQHFWTTDQSQIYRALYKMQDIGWVDFETIIQQESPNKKVYHITHDGIAELNRWLSESVEENPPNYIWLAQLYLGASLDQDTIRRLLSQRLKQVRELQVWTQRNYDTVRNQDKSLSIDKLRLLTLEYKLRMLETEQEWLEGTLKHIAGVIAS
jgi:DNA-binding PadR family transcriptional regulator